MLACLEFFHPCKPFLLLAIKNKSFTLYPRSFNLWDIVQLLIRLKELLIFNGLCDIINSLINKNLKECFSMKSKWKDTPLLHKIVTIVSILTNLSVFVLAVLQMFDIWNQAINIYVPLMGITMLCQAYIQWNTSRKFAYFSIGTAIFVFICAIGVFFVK